MSGLILPSGAPAKAKDKPEPKESYEALTEEQKAAVAALAEKENPEDHYPEVEYAFVIVKQPDGQYAISDDLNLKVAPKRTADENDYMAAFAVIQSNIQATNTAVLVQQSMVQQAAMMQRAMADQQLQARLNLK